MKYLFYLGHPAHFHLFKNTINELNSKNHSIQIVIKKKDVLEELLKSEGWTYKNIYPRERKDNKFSIALSLLVRDWAFLKIARNFKPDLMIGTSAEITHIGKLLSIPSVVVNEDDAEVVPLFAKLSYPFASNILVPSGCSVGKWDSKTIFYQGYHELAYLHPNKYKTVPEKLSANRKQKIFFIRFAKLTAHHDEGKSGISNQLAYIIIERLSKEGRVYISSERVLDEKLEKYRIKLQPSEVLNFLASSDLYIGDSQTMTAEAAVLGIPSIRFNDFVGKLSYLEELEHKYGLTYGIKTSEPEKLLEKIDELLSFPNIKEEWQKRRMKMLSEKIDVTAFMVWFIENYPASVKVMKENPAYQDLFK
jgi:uncharacterized protein